jgi:hypothetical protein
VHINGGSYERVEKVRNVTVVGQSVSNLEIDDAPMTTGTANLNAAKLTQVNGCDHRRLFIALALLGASLR